MKVQNTNKLREKFMPYTVTQRIRAVEQPAEGYIPITKFSVKKYEDFWTQISERYGEYS